MSIRLLPNGRQMLYLQNTNMLVGEFTVSRINISDKIMILTLSDTDEFKYRFSWETQGEGNSLDDYRELIKNGVVKPKYRVCYDVKIDITNEFGVYDNTRRNTDIKNIKENTRIKILFLPKCFIKEDEVELIPTQIMIMTPI